MLLANYKSKKELKKHIGMPLQYIETSMFGEEYKANGVLTVANLDLLTNGREWFGQVTMKDGLIFKVS